MSIWHVAEKNKCPVTKTLYLSIITEFFIDAKWVCDESEDGQGESIAFISLRKPINLTI